MLCSFYHNAWILSAGFLSSLTEFQLMSVRLTVSSILKSISSVRISCLSLLSVTFPAAIVLPQPQPLVLRRKSLKVELKLKVKPRHLYRIVCQVVFLSPSPSSSLFLTGFTHVTAVFIFPALIFYHPTIVSSIFLAPPYSHLHCLTIKFVWCSFFCFNLRCQAL